MHMPWYWRMGLIIQVSSRFLKLRLPHRPASLPVLRRNIICPLLIMHPAEGAEEPALPSIRLRPLPMDLPTALFLSYLFQETTMALIYMMYGPKAGPK